MGRRTATNLNSSPNRIKPRFQSNPPEVVEWHEREERRQTYKGRQKYIVYRAEQLGTETTSKEYILKSIKSTYATRILSNESILFPCSPEKANESIQESIEEDTEEKPEEDDIGMIDETVQTGMETVILDNDETKSKHRIEIDTQTEKVNEKKDEAIEEDPQKEIAEGIRLSLLWFEESEKIRLMKEEKMKSREEPLKIISTFYKPKTAFRDLAYYPQNECSSYVKRLLLDKDLSEGMAEFPIQVFCDKGITGSDLIFSTAFSYKEENNYNMLLNQRLDCKELSVSCECKGPCKPESCACHKLHMKFYGDYINHKGAGVVVDNYDYFENGVNRNHFDTFLIMCGDLCGCDPNKCQNHINRLKRTDHRFEIFRRDEEVGFGVRILNSMNMGDIVTEVVGTVYSSKESNVEPYRRNYSVILSSTKSNPRIEKLYSSAHLDSKKVKTVTVDDKNTNWYIDMSYGGNASRFVNHGCMANTAPIRVVANYLHPAFHRIFLMAVAPIQFGNELLMNYNDTIRYKNFTGKDCHCNTPLCESLLQDTPKELQMALTKDEFISELLYYYDTMADSVVQNTQIEQDRIEQQNDEHADIVEMEEQLFEIKSESSKNRQAYKRKLDDIDIEVQVKALRIAQETVCREAEQYLGLERNDRSKKTSTFNKEFLKYEGDIARIKKTKNTD